MTVAETSIEAYEAHKESGKLGQQARFIMNRMEPGKSYSRSELSQVTGLRLSSICGRVNELVEQGWLEECEPRPCRLTGKRVKPVRKASLF